MANRGRPPKPVEQKRLIGNPGKRPLPAVAGVHVLPQADGVPDPPMQLGEDGLDLWRRAWGQGLPWVSPQSDWAQVVEACRLVDDLAAARGRYRATREPSDGRIVATLSKSLTDALSALGFNPLARTRLGVAEVKRVSKLEELLADRQARRGSFAAGAQTVGSGGDALDV